MRIPDRFWWLRLVAALMYLLATPFFLYWYFTYIHPYDLRHPTITLSDTILAIFIVCALLARALHAVLATRLELQRDARRAAVLAGGPNALPLAQVAAEEVPADTPALVEAVQVHLTRRIADIVITCAFWAGGFVFCADLVLAVVLSPLGIQVPTLSSPSARPSAHPIHYPVLAAIVWFGAMSIVTLFFLFAELSTLRFIVKRIQVSDDGLTCLSLLGSRRFLAWRDAQLLEVWGPHRHLQQGKPLIEIRRYSLYSRSTVLRWEERRSPPGARIMPVFEHIAPAVRLHTGLLPRTLYSETLAPDAVLSFARLDRIVARLPRWLTYVTGGVVFLSLASVDRTFSVVVLVYVCIGSFAWLISRAGKRQQTQVVTADFQPTIPTCAPLLHQGAVYEMTVGSTSAFRTTQGSVILLGLVGVIAPLFLLVSQFVVVDLHQPIMRFRPLPYALVPILVACIPLGVAIITGALRAKDTILLADATGLRKRWAMGKIFLAWGDVVHIERRHIYGYQGYVVYGRNGRTRIAWPSRYFVPSQRAQEAGTILTTPDEMAALVAEQISQPIQVGRQR